MSAEKSTRKLAAIMFTDMVGYTALMEKDEPKARKLIERHRELMKPLVEKHGGEVLQFVGDGTFCTFSSAIEATNSSIEIQRTLKNEMEISIRIGIHIGDVVSDGDEVYGDGVNVASRLEPLAEPGGICISGEVSNNLKNQPGIETLFLGKKKLKNVEHLVEVYALVGKDLVVPDVVDTAQEEMPEPKIISDKIIEKQDSSKKLISIAAVVVAVIGLWLLLQQFGGGSVQEVTADENSIAVLFIENMIDPEDTKHEAEMLRELLITDLSQSKTLQVISSQRLYDIAKQDRGKGANIIDRENASEVAKKARAQWMLTGKLAQFGSRKVLTTQIANVRTGKILNAQRADGTDLFAMVDALTKEVRKHLGDANEDAASDLPIAEKTTGSSEAYQYYTQGATYLNRQEFSKAAEKFEKAVELDDDFIQALYSLSVAYWWRDVGVDSNAVATLEKLLSFEKKMNEKETLRAEALLALVGKKYEEAIKLYQSIIEKFPNDKEAYYGLGESYFHAGENNVKALDAFEKVLSLDPTFTLAFGHIFTIYNDQELYDRGIEKANAISKADPSNISINRDIGNLYRAKGKYEFALEYYNKGLSLDPDDHRFTISIAGTYRRMGKYEKAFEKVEELYKMDLPDDHKMELYAVEASLNERLGKAHRSIEIINKALALPEATQARKNDIFGANLSLIGNYAQIGDMTEAFRLVNENIELEEIPAYKTFLFLIKANLYLESQNISALSSLKNELREYAKNNKTGLAAFDVTYIVLNFYESRLNKDHNEALLLYGNLSVHPEWRDFLLSEKILIHIEKEDFEEALSSVAKLARPNVNTFSGTIYKSHILYLYGRIYEASGETSLAIAKYKELLEFWKDADEDLVKLIETKERLAALESNL